MCMYFLNKTTDGFRNNQFIMSSFTMTQEQEQILSSYITPKYPMRVSFKSGEEFEEDYYLYLWEGLNDYFVSKILGKPLLKYDGSDLKEGETFMVLDVVGGEDALCMDYKNNLIECYDNLLQVLIDKEEYEMCNTVSLFKQIYDKKFSK